MSSLSDKAVAYDALRLCARGHLDDATRGELVALLQRLADWTRFIELAEYHRLTSIVAHHLARLGDPVPPTILGHLNRTAAEHAHRNLALSAELASLLDTFQERSVDVIPYKGPFLALAAWGDLALRPYTDLDLLVDPADLNAAAALLRDRGYACAYSFTPRQDRIFARMDGDYPFTSPRGILVELHARVASKRFAIPLHTRDLMTRSVETPFGGRPARSLSREDLILVLCMHGCKHRWASLGWVADVAELAKSGVDWEALLQRAADIGAARILTIGLILAGEELNVELPAVVQRRIGADVVAKRLAKEASAWLRDAHVPATAGMIRYNYAALDNPAARVKFAARWLFGATPEDFAAISLPAPLTPLYTVIRPARLALRYGRRQSIVA